MSTEPDETLIEELAGQPAFAEEVERWLDAHPLPLDEPAAELVARRLHARMTARNRRIEPWWGLVALAAAALLAALPFAPTPVEVDVVEPVPPLLRAEVPPTVREVREIARPGARDLLDRSLQVSPDSVVLSSEDGRSAVVLVQEGSARVGAVEVPEDHWAVWRSGAEVVVFPDGRAPPLPDDALTETHTHEQLRAVRWMALPDETLDALEGLLEQR